MKKFYYFIPLVSAIIFLVGNPVFASAANVLYFEMPTGTIAAGTVFTIQALIDAAQPVNAYDLTIAYNGPVKIVAVNDAHSIITVFQSQPTSQDGMIALQGGSFSPFSGSLGELATIYVSAEASGTATFSFINSAVYAADGKGTTILPKTVPLTVAITPGPAGSAAFSNGVPSSTLGMSGIPNSTPQISFLQIIRDPSSGHELLSFLANDAGSGIAGTFVRYRTMFTWGPWQDAANYSPVPSNAWEVELRATNNAGVSTEQTIYDKKNIELLLRETVAGLIVIIGCVVTTWVWRKRRRSFEK